MRLVNPGVTYASLWCCRPTADESALVEERLRRPPCRKDDLDDLVGAAPEHVRAWMERKAALADAGRARPLLVAPVAVLETVARAQAEQGAWTAPSPRGPARELWSLATCGLLHSLAGQTIRECAARQRCSYSLAVLRLRRHQEHLREADYAKRVADLATVCLRGLPVPLLGSLKNP